MNAALLLMAGAHAIMTGALSSRLFDMLSIPSVCQMFILQMVFLGRVQRRRLLTGKGGDSPRVKRSATAPQFKGRRRGFAKKAQAAPAQQLNGEIVG